MLPFSRVALVVVALTTTSVSQAASTPLRSFKVAAVAYDPAWSDLDGNITRWLPESRTSQSKA